MSITAVRTLAHIFQKPAKASPSSKGTQLCVFSFSFWGWAFLLGPNDVGRGLWELEEKGIGTEDYEGSLISFYEPFFSKSIYHCLDKQNYQGLF